MTHGLAVIWLLLSFLVTHHSVLGDAIQTSTSSATNVVTTKYPTPYITPINNTLKYPTPYVTKPPISPEMPLPKPTGTPLLFGDKPATGSISGQAKLNDKLSTSRLQKCQEVAAKIKQEANTSITNLENVYASMSSVLIGVDTYYKKAIVPSGKTVTNYDVFFSTATVQQQTFLKSIQIAQTDLSSFSCSSTGPGKQIALFKQDIQQAVANLKNLRNSIKTIVVAIKNVIEPGTDTNTTATSSAK